MVGSRTGATPGLQESFKEETRRDATLSHPFDHARGHPHAGRPPIARGGGGHHDLQAEQHQPRRHPPVTEVVTYVVPPGAINDKTVESPLTILEGSSGFDPEALLVAVGNGEVPEGQENAGDPVQGLALNFGPDGFAPGGVFNFSLNLNPAISDAPDLVLLPDSPAGLAIEDVPPTSVDVGGDDGVDDDGGDGDGGETAAATPVVPPGRWQRAGEPGPRADVGGDLVGPGGPGTRPRPQAPPIEPAPGLTRPRLGSPTDRLAADGPFGHDGRFRRPAWGRLMPIPTGRGTAIDPREGDTGRRGRLAQRGPDPASGSGNSAARSRPTTRASP